MIAEPALVLIDMQKDFCKEGFAFDVPGRDFGDVPSTLRSAGNFLDRYRDSGRTPILVRVIQTEHTVRQHWRERDEPIPCVRGTEGAEFVPELNVRESDVVVTKHRYSSFANTTLETLLRGNDVNELLVGGLNTNVCVGSTVQDAFDHDYDVTILSDCTATTQPEFHRPYLESLERNGFARVRESGDVELPDLGDQIADVESD